MILNIGEFIHTLLLVHEVLSSEEMKGHVELVNAAVMSSGGAFFPVHRILSPLAQVSTNFQGMYSACTNYLRVCKRMRMHKIEKKNATHY